MNYNDLSNEILDMDLAIRFAGVCDETGVIKYGRERQGIENVLSLEETKKSNLQELARWNMRNYLAPKTGKGKYAMAEYEKIKRITFPLEDSHLLLITTDVKADHEKIIKSILNLLKY
jgi:hypothetical protein